MSSTAAPFPVNTRFFTISTAGHVDHGKTSLIRALTGIDPDRLKEEKERQMTTDLGFAHLKLGDNLMVGFVDVPGHGKFLKNMLAGVGGIDMALLVVSADEGPMPQTLQHVRILSLLGVTKAVVALTKIDMVDDMDHRAIVEDDIRQMLQAHGIEMLALMPVSSTQKIGLNELKSRLESILRTAEPRETKGGAFLPVDRVFSKAGFGTVITGTVVRGKLAVGDQFVVGPDISSGRVRRLETFGHPVNEAVPGQRVACNVVLKDSKPLVRGNVILGRDLPATRSLLVSLVDRPRLAGDRLVERLEGQPVRLYHGTAECHGFIRWAQVSEELSDKDISVAIALIALDDPAVALAQDRFVIRLSDETIFGGEVLVREKPKWMKRTDLLALAGKILSGDFNAAVTSFVESHPQQIARASQVELLVPVPMDKELVDKLVAEKKLVRLGELIMDPQTRGDLSTKLKDAISKAFEQAKQAGREPESVPLEVVRTLLSPKLDRPGYGALIDEELAANRIVRKADQLSLPSAGAPKGADSAATALQAKISEILNEHLCLEITEVAKACGIDVNKAKNTIHAMAKAGQLHIVAYDFAISSENLRKAHQVLADIWQVKKNISPSDFRDGLGTTRKYAMALLQHFDDNRVTRRLNEGRVLLRGPDKV